MAALLYVKKYPELTKCDKVSAQAKHSEHPHMSAGAAPSAGDGSTGPKRETHRHLFS